jgi:hypothetical protein
VDTILRDFADVLRQNGMRVSPAEVADAARAAELVPMEDRAAFRAALRSTLCKRGSDARAFDNLFDLWFSGAGALLNGLENALVDALREDGLTPEELEEVARAIERATQQEGAGPVLKPLLDANLTELARLLRAAMRAIDFRGLQSQLQRGFYARRLLAGAGAGRLYEELRTLENDLREHGMQAPALDLVSRRLQEALRALEDAARRVADTEQRARDEDLRARAEGDLARRSFATLSPHEIERMRGAVRKLAEKLKSRIARKRRRARRGTLHMRRTLRKNLSHDAIPAVLAFRSRRPERPEVVILCDVSDSVRSISRLLLQFVYTLQELYARVRSFVFVSDLGEVTRLFKEAPVEEAVDLSTAGRVVNLAANSNYGRAFSIFHRDFAPAITRRTTVIVIGDGRTNYNPPHAWVLEEVRRRARRVVWLCPEDRAAWGFGDSVMPLYARHVHETHVVKSLRDLNLAAERILP